MQNSKILLVTTLSVGSLGLALASGCSSSSTPSTTNTDAGESSSSSSSGGTTSSSSSGAAEAAAAACMSAAVCGTGEICCGISPEGSACQAPPCGSTPLGPIQLCATAAECVPATDVCTVDVALMAALSISITTCQAAGDGGTAATKDGGEAGTSAGGSSSGVDSGATAAPPGG